MDNKITYYIGSKRVELIPFYFDPGNLTPLEEARDTLFKAWREALIYGEKREYYEKINKITHKREGYKSLPPSKKERLIARIERYYSKHPEQFNRYEIE